MDTTSHFTFSAEALSAEALHTVEEQLQSMETDGTPISEGQRILELAEIHLKMCRISQAEDELLSALILLLQYSNDILREGNAITEVIPHTLFVQEHRPTQILILELCKRAAEKLSGICSCGGRKQDAKTYDKFLFKIQESLRNEIAMLSEPQLIPMKVVGTDFISVHASPIS